MRILCCEASLVRRSQARTRRSKVARPAPGSSTGRRLCGATMANRASVRASMELDLAWRERNLRRSEAFWELTRYTAWPRRPKNTVGASHAGPVGSSTTSRTVPSGAPSRACCSIHPRLSAVGMHRRRHTSVPSPVSTTTVWALAMPRSTPTIRRSATGSSFPGPHVSCRTSAVRTGDAFTTTVPRWLSPTAAPTHVLQTGPAHRGAVPLPSTGASVAGPEKAISPTTLGTSGASLRADLDASLPDQPG